MLMSAWTLRVTVFPDESLSSWLARAALSQGCDPLVLTGAIWPNWRIWTQDVDRGIERDRLHNLVAASGVSLEEFEAAALRTEAERIAGVSLSATMTWPWILALGKRNRAHRGGQQYCPACLAEDEKPYFRRHWRFAWHTTCAVHGIRLMDRCPSCGSPIEPHRLVAEDRHLAWCARCKSDLRMMAGATASSRDGAVAFQRTADEIVSGTHSAAFGKKTLSISDWFGLSQFLYGLIRQASRRESSALAELLSGLGITAGSCLLPASGLAFEYLPVMERQSLLDATYQLLSLGPDRMKTAFQDAGLTEAGLLLERRTYPDVIMDMTAALPSGKRASRQAGRSGGPTRARSRREVWAAWTRLQRKMFTETT